MDFEGTWLNRAGKIALVVANDDHTGFMWCDSDGPGYYTAEGNDAYGDRGRDLMQRLSGRAGKVSG
jgi:hypothetical protein